jgi:hypothetical protein
MLVLSMQALLHAVGVGTGALPMGIYRVSL